MKRSILPLILTLSTLVGCGRDAMQELVAIDTLLQSNPDSAYVLIKKIDGIRLSAQSEAYRALLYTQAQYKTSDLIVSDSLIEIAVNYYKNGKDKEKRTQAYLYKGAVLAEMGLTREAIDWYKKTEQVADTLDYLTLGLLNTRMGELYDQSYIENGKHLERYKTALKYYRKANHKLFENSTLCKIAICYTILNKDSAYNYIDKSIHLAKERKDSAMISYNTIALIGIHEYYRNYQSVIDICNSDINKNRMDFHVCKFVIPAYAKLGKIDSAQMYLRYIDPQTDKQRVVYYMALEQIALAKGDYKSAYKYCNSSNELADSIMKVAKQDDLYSIEKRLDNKYLQNINTNLKNESQIKSQIIIITALIVFIICTFGIIFWRKKKLMYKQLNAQFEQMQIDIKQTNNLLAQYNSQTSEMKEVLRWRQDSIRKILELQYEFGSTPEIFAKKLCQLSDLNKQSEGSCQQIIKLANLLNNDLIDTTIKQFTLSPDEVLLLALSCLNCTATEVCIFLQKSTTGSVYTMRTRLASKLRASSIEDYIARNTMFHGVR